jgi:hypothetical protein
VDFTIWANQFRGSDSARSADFNQDGFIDGVDFTIWRNSFLGPN